MPFTYSIDPERHIVTSTAFGVVSDEDFLMHNRKLPGDERFDPAFRQIIDLTGIQPGSRVKTSTLHELAQKNPFSPCSRRAIVAVTELAFGLARMYGLLLGGTCSENTGVFQSREEAEAWLSEPGPVAEPP
ncbi:MAG: hypothetical protein R6V62_06725 [Candidatus Fermentibacteraceae bacterium]